MRMAEERVVVDRLRAIVARWEAGLPARDGLKDIHDHVASLRTSEPEVEVRFTASDGWAHRLFAAVCRRYGLEPYRYRGQRSTTGMVSGPQSFIQESMWPELQALHQELLVYVEEVTGRIIRDAIGADAGDVKEQSTTAERS